MLKSEPQIDRTRLQLGVVAAQAVRANLPLDGFGDHRRLTDYADIWGVAARNAILDSPEFTSLLHDAEHRGAARVVAAVRAWAMEAEISTPPLDWARLGAILDQNGADQ